MIVKLQKELDAEGFVNYLGRSHVTIIHLRSFCVRCLSSRFRLRDCVVCFHVLVHQYTDTHPGRPRLLGLWVLLVTFAGQDLRGLELHLSRK